MSFSLLARKLACGIALAVPAIVSAQSGFAPLGGEYAIAGALPGDQVMPSAGVNANGGYLVWQDNATDGDGWGIHARALNGTLSGNLSPFRINSTSKWDQENPKVALLADGGAVFVWQGGRQGFQHIYARFLSSSNSWLGLDQMVNASAKTYQARPAVVVLNNGNVVIVYSTFNASTMQDVYGQIFSPAGQKIGVEFQVNASTTFNQRSPSIAALPGGGFVVAFVSEQQSRATVAQETPSPKSQLKFPSVDIYARLFDTNGVPATATEFIVNNTLNACANPVVAVAADGSVMFAWSEKDQHIRLNSWDISARSFTFPTSVSQIAGVERHVNQQLYGDQYAPQISTQGTNHLVVWTSLGQDGSSSAIYGRYLNLDGSPSGDEFRINTTTLGTQREPSVAADGYGRFLTVWTSPTYSATGNDLFAQLYAGGGFPSPGNVLSYGAPKFVGDATATRDSSRSSTNNILSPYVEIPVLDYPGVLPVARLDTPDTNAFVLAAGNYRGLFYEAAGVSTRSAGYFAAKTGPGRSYTATVTIGGASHGISGKFDLFGNSEKETITRAGKSSLVVTFQEDLFGGDQIRGQIKAGAEWVANLIADRDVYDKTTNPSPHAGQNYTMVIPGTGNGSTRPAGDSFCTISNDASGVVSWNLTMADGTTLLKKSSAISKSGFWPLYGAFSGGMVMGWIQFTTNESAGNAAVSGDFVWIKAANKLASYYPRGFTNETSVIGARYVSLLSGVRQLSLTGASLAENLTYQLQFNGATVVDVSTNKLNKVTVKSSTGEFTGIAPTAVKTKTITFQGVLLDGGTGAGFFRNGGLSDKVILDLPQAP